MPNKPKQIDVILYDDKFADCWTIGVEYDNDDYKTLSCSDNPSHPQGVFSSSEEKYSDENDNEYLIKEWEDLPETLQKFLINYINVSLE